MIDSIKRITLDLHDLSSRETVEVKRSDTGRKICISLIDGGMPYHIADGCYAVFTGKRPDGKVVPDDCTIEGNVIVYGLTKQTSAVPGLVKCEIKLYGADEKLITSPRFSIMVDDTVWDGEDEIPEDIVRPGGSTGVVKSVNGVEPDENGNVEIEVGGASQEQIAQAVEEYMAEHPVSGGGLNATAKALLISILRNGVFVSDQSESITALESALASGGGDDSGGSGDSGDSGDGGDDSHIHRYIATVTTAATCETAGVRTYVCSCGNSYTEAIPATGHNYVDGVCTVCGQTQPDTPPSGETQTITFTQTGSVLAISGIDNITTMTQSGSVLALA